MSTIVAISTATGSGGIGIIRMSGKNAFEILSKIFIPVNKDEEIRGYTIKYGYIVDSTTKEKIDEVLVSYFKNPKSYTTEDMCEINSHGGTVIERAILEQCLKNGAELAEPGEFTKRAFLNGRIDLTQAESVIDIINSKTEKEAKASINQLKGVLSEKINEIKNNLLEILSDIEATIDYPEYDLEEVTNNKVVDSLDVVYKKLLKLSDTFIDGKILKEGVKTVILGRPNAGKSSLLNSILKEDRAIVSEIEGTTRDTIEEYVTIGGIPLKIIDTAGIRNTTDKIEELGVEKAIKLANEAELIIAIFDSTESLNNDDMKILKILSEKSGIILLNKVDLKNNILATDKNILNTSKKIIEISAKNNYGIEKLYKEIGEMFRISEIEVDNGIIITNVRHKNQIDKSIKSLIEAKKVLDNKLPIDIIAIYLKQILNDLGEITGDNVSDDIINKIFSKFCLGK